MVEIYLISSSFSWKESWVTDDLTPINTKVTFVNGNLHFLNTTPIPLRIIDVLILIKHPNLLPKLDNINLSKPINSLEIGETNEFYTSKELITEISTGNHLNGKHKTSSTPQKSRKTKQHNVRFPLNLNLAKAEELMVIPGIGPKLAHHIIAYRHKHKFNKIEDLQLVKGIGEKRYLKIKRYLKV